MVVAVLATTTLVLAIIFGPRLWRAMTTDGAGLAAAPPGPPPAEATIDGVDLRRIHTELFPAWVVTRANPGAPLQEERAFTALHAALEPNATLASLATELRQHTAHDRLWRHDDQERALALIRDWNRVLDEAQIPYLLRANLMASGDAVRFYALSCEVMAQARVAVGPDEHRVRLVRRVDRLNLREWYMGMVREQEEGVVIIIDRVSDFATNEVWPLLDPTADTTIRGALHAAFTTAVAEEAATHLPPAVLERLRSTAAARLALVAAVESIRQRHACGSRFIIATIPWNGFDEDELAPIRQAQRRASGACPEVTRDELDAIERASTTLHQAEGLRPAVETLVAWVSRPLVIHEARHAADLSLAKTARARSCQWCGPHDPEATRIELSAYLAELAWTQSPAVALFQVCHATAGDPGVGHGEALEVIMDRSEHSCSDGALPRANAVARALEADAFGRSDPIEIRGEYPSRLTVDDLQWGH